MRLWVRLSSSICVLLILWAAVVESTHLHPTAIEATSCSICVAAHSTQPTISSSLIIPQFVAISLLREEDVVAKAQFEVSDEGIRGPPVL
jgi:hypothetical protein